MNISKQQAILKEIRAFIKKHFGDEEWVTSDMQFLTGEEAIKYSNYASEQNAYISFDGFMYEFFQGEDGWKFINAFDEFLDSLGLWYEFGNAWNANIMEK